MSERDDFLAWVGTRLRNAEVAVHAGDAGPRRDIWSRHEPVTVFGAWKNSFGRAELDDLFTMLERQFSECASYEYQIVAADVVGNMAYTVGYEHTQAVVDGKMRDYVLRSTQIYRREGAEWKVVHRHADSPPDGS